MWLIYDCDLYTFKFLQYVSHMLVFCKKNLGIDHFINFVVLILSYFRQLSSVSPSGNLQAIVRKVPGTKGQEDKQFLEVIGIIM